MTAKKKRQALPGGAPVSTRKKKPKRQARPGGAVTARAKGRTLATGRAPSPAPKPARAKRKAAPKAPRAPKPKPPCKYGPRGADGYCPKKPFSLKSTKRNRTTVTGRTADSAVEQGIQVLTNPKATASQKTQAVSQVGTTILADAARKTARKQAAPIKEFVKKYGSTIAGVALPAYIAVKAAKQIPIQRRKEATAFANRELAKTKSRMKQPLPPDQEKILWQQYFDWFVRQPVTNPFLGK